MKAVICIQLREYLATVNSSQMVLNRQKNMSLSKNAVVQVIEVREDSYAAIGFWYDYHSSTSVHMLIDYADDIKRLHTLEISSDLIKH